MDSKVRYKVIGLMSGTSADGVDAALVECHGYGLATQVRVLAHATYPYDVALRAQILAASYPESSSVDLICHLNFALGECFAEAAMAVANPEPHSAQVIITFLSSSQSPCQFSDSKFRG